MNHNPSDDSANVPSSGQAVVAGVNEASARTAAYVQEHHEVYQLNSSLQQALGCLDIKLEDELTRFRSKQKHQFSGADPRPSMQSAQVSEAIWEQQSADFDANAEILTAEIVQPVIPSTIKADDALGEGRHQQDLPRSSTDGAVPTGGFIIIDGLTISATNSRNAITTVNYAPIELHRETLAAIQASPDPNSSSGGKIAPFHDEYLSSSQELLRQIQSGYSAASANSSDNRAKSAPKRNYLMPIAIGSIAAACVMAVGAAYTYLNSSILASLTTTKVVAPTAATTASSLGQSIQSPNLAANEFTDLSLSTLNTIKLPTAAPTTNVSMTTAPKMNATATTPAAIPFNGAGARIVPPATTTSQPRLADSLVKSLLPSSFQSYIKPSGNRATPPGMNR